MCIPERDFYALVDAADNVPLGVKLSAAKWFLERGELRKLLTGCC
jgi:hypothetical protein